MARRRPVYRSPMGVQWHPPSVSADSRPQRLRHSRYVPPLRHLYACRRSRMDTMDRHAGLFLLFLAVGILAFGIVEVASHVLASEFLES